MSSDSLFFLSFFFLLFPARSHTSYAITFSDVKTIVFSKKKILTPPPLIYGHNEAHISPFKFSLNLLSFCTLPFFFFFSFLLSFSTSCQIPFFFLCTIKYPLFPTLTLFLLTHSHLHYLDDQKSKQKQKNKTKESLRRESVHAILFCQSSVVQRDNDSEDVCRECTFHQIFFVVVDRTMI